MTKKQIVVNELNSETKFSNTFRLGYSDTEIVIDFGYVVENNENFTIDVLSKITMSPNTAIRLVKSLFKVVELVNKENEESRDDAK